MSTAEHKTDPTAATDCTQLINTLTTKLNSGSDKIQWIKTLHDYIKEDGEHVPCYIAVERGDRNGYDPLMRGEYYIELHVHTGVQVPTRMSTDKIRIKKQRSPGGNLITTRPNNVPPISNTQCNIFNKRSGTSPTPYTFNPHLIRKAFQDIAVFFTDQRAYSAWRRRETALRTAQTQQTVMTPEEIAVQDKVDSWSRAHEYFGDVLQNELNYGYGEYSDYVKSENTGLQLYDNVNYGSLLLVFCGGIILILLCLVCFAVALIYGFLVGKSVRKMKDSGVISFDIENELHS